MAKKTDKVKKPKKIKITKVTFGLGNTKSLANMESLRVFTEIEVKLKEGDKVADIQELLRGLVNDINLNTIAFVTKESLPVEVTVPVELAISYIKCANIGHTKNLGSYEFLKVNNGLEAAISKGQDVLEVYVTLRDAVLKLNERDFNTLINK